MSSYLVVANETASGAELREYLMRRACRDRSEKFVLLMPATPVQDLLAWEAGESLEMARERALDAYHALRDEGLPIVDGFQVAKLIRQEPALKNVVLVALTGYGQDADRQRTREAGFDYHLVKPVDFAKVEHILSIAAESSR